MEATTRPTKCHLQRRVRLVNRSTSRGRISSRFRQVDRQALSWVGRDRGRERIDVDRCVGVEREGVDLLMMQATLGSHRVELGLCVAKLAKLSTF